MREPEGGWLNRTFIGRHEEREQVKTRLLRDGGILLLFGQPLVGKASLAFQVAEELREEQNDVEGSSPLCVYTVDCKDTADWPDIMRAMCRAFSLDETAANENLVVGAILQQLRRSGCRKLVLLLLRVHGLDPTGTDLQSMMRCLRSLAAADVMAIVTSRRQLQLPSVLRVPPLTLSDDLQLLRHHAPDVNAEEFQTLLQRYCYGLPPLVLQLAQLVSGDPMLAYTAVELRQALEEDSGLLMKGLDEEAKKLFSTLSPEVQGHVSTLAQLLDGSFSLEALQAVVGLDGPKVKAVVRRLYDEAPLLIDSDSQRMRIEPLVLHHIRQIGHVTADDQARLRVVTLLGRVLTRAECDLYVSGQDTVYGHLHGDWPQLQHVLRQAIHCTGDTYQAYMQVALKADKLLAKCFPHEALLFYKSMASAAIRFGTSRDQAMLQGLIGMAVTLGQGTGWQEALSYFHRALPALQQEKHSLSYLRLLCDLGFAYFRLNRLQESDRYLREAVSVSHETNVEDERELLFQLLRARSLLALPSIFRGHLSESKALLFETLELCEQYAPHHPDKPVLINSLGLVYERSGEDQDRALQYYRQSLVERRRYADVAPGDLVAPLNNVAMQYTRRGDFDIALQYLEEAAAIRARDTRWHYHTALTQQHLGQVSLQKGDYKRAEHHLLEAACVYSRCTPYHDVRGKVALCLAHLYVPERDVTQTQRYLKEVCELAEGGQKDLSDSGLVVLMCAIQHRLQLGGWASATVTSLLDWAQRLLADFDGDPSDQLATHQAIMSDIRAVTESGGTEDQKEALVRRIMEQCQMCQILSDREDTRALWRRLEDEGQDIRSAISTLRSSAAVRNVLSLSRASGPPQQHDTIPKRAGGQDASWHGQEGSAGAPPIPQRLVHHHQAPGSGPEHRATGTDRQTPRPSQPGGYGQGQFGAHPSTENQLLRELVDHHFRQRERSREGEATAGGEHDAEQRTPMPSLPGLAEHARPSRDPGYLSCEGETERRGQDGPDQWRTRPHETVRSEQGLRVDDAEARRRRAVLAPMASSGPVSSCFFTNSMSSDVTSVGGRDPAGSDARWQQEQVTLYERVRVPLQETARDQDSEGIEGTEAWEARPSGGFAGVAPTMSASVGLAAGGSASGERAVVWEPDAGRLVTRAGPPPAGTLAYTESSGPDAAARYGDPLRSAVQSAPPPVSSQQFPRAPHSQASGPPPTSPALPSQASRPLLTSTPSSPATWTTLTPPASPSQASRPLLASAPSSQASVSPLTSSAATVYETSVASSPTFVCRPPPSLESVVTCAQQLIAVMTPGDVATSEQRRALEKIASLGESPPGAPSAHGVGSDVSIVQQTLLNVMNQSQLATQQLNPVVAGDQWEALSKWASKARQSQEFADSPAVTDPSTFTLTTSRETSRSKPSLMSATEMKSELAKVPRAGADLPVAAVTTAASRTDVCEEGGGKNLVPSGTEVFTVAAASSPHTTPGGRQAIERHRKAGRPEPTEGEDLTELEPQPSIHRAGKEGFRGDTELESRRREPTENDERLEDPGHVCTSHNCCCSLRVTPR